MCALRTNGLNENDSGARGVENSDAIASKLSRGRTGGPLKLLAADRHKSTLRLAAVGQASGVSAEGQDCTLFFNPI